MSNRLILTNFYNFDSIYFSLPFFKITSIGCTCKACAASSSEKINIDFVCEIVNFGSPNLIILKKKVKEYNKISQYFHNIFIFRIRIDFYFILFERNATFITFLEQILNDKLLLVLN